MRKRRHFRAAFTLIELLVAITIVIVLIGLLFPVMRLVRERAYWLDTANRIELLRRALADTSSEDGSVAAALQRAAGMPGAIRTSFSHNHADPTLRGQLVVQEGSGFLAYDQPWQLRFPLGRPAVGFWADTPYAWVGSHSNWDFVRLEEKAGIPFTASEATARFSAELVAAAGVAPDAATYRSDRNATAGWNDPWGNPLIVAAALYQYGPANAGTASRWPWVETFANGKNPGERAAGTPAFTKQWREVLTHYGSTRSLYLFVGALGPEGPATFTAPLTQANLDASWQHIMTVCNTAPDGTELWRVDPTATPAVDALANPPWQGLRQQSLGTKRSALALPLVIE